MRKSVGRILQATIIISMLLICLNLASAATYYVNNKNSNCKDSYTKTQAQSLTTPWCSFNTGLENLNSGDTLYLLDGTYTATDGFVLKDKDFSAKTRIKAYTGTKPVLTSRIPEFDIVPNTKWTKVSSGLWSTNYVSSEPADSWFAAYSSTGVTLFSYTSLSELKNTANPEGIFFDNAANKLYLRLTDLNANPNNIAFSISHAFVFSISNVAGAGLEISNLIIQWGAREIEADGSSNISLQNNVIKGGFWGIDFRTSDNIKIQDNKVFMNANPNWNWNGLKGSLLETTGIRLQNDLQALDISGNEVYGYFNGIMIFSDSTGKFRDLKVYDNYVHDIMDDGIEIEDYCNGGQFYNNTVSDVFVAISLSPANAAEKTCLVYNNVLIPSNKIKWDSGGSLMGGECYKIISDSGCRNFNFNHNTCIGRGVYTTTDYSHTQRNNVWKDNIFYSPDTDKILEKAGLSADGVSYDYNLYWRTDGDAIFSYWNSDTKSTDFLTLASAKDSSLWDGKWDIHSKQADPLFTNLASNDLKPKTGSPACTMSSTGSYVGAIPCITSTTNHAPTQSKPLLRASDYPDNSSLADLYCYNQSTADVDGDRVVNKYRWFRNSTYMSAFDNKTMVGVANTLRFQTWICEVTPNDGHVYGTPMNSSPLYIRAPPTCGDKICNLKENCSTCAADCGSCPVPSTKITGCVLEDVSWDENEALRNVYDLNSCFDDPLNTALKFSSRGTRSITVTITNGMVSLSSPSDWTGVEHVVFVATSGNRTASTNNITLTVNHVPVCGDDVCEDGETCESCSSDCGTCPKPKPSGGGGGGGGGSYIPSTSTDDSPSNDTTNESSEIAPVIVPDTSIPGEDIIPPTSSEPVQEPALTEDNSNLETTTGSGFKEPDQLTGSAVAEPLSNPLSNNNLIPIVFVTLVLILVVPGVYVVSKNHGQLLAKFKRTHPVVYYEGDVSDNSEQSHPDFFTKLHDLVSTAISRGYEKPVIATKLRDAGWSEDIVESVLNMHNKDFVMKALESSGLDSSHADELHNYVNKAVERGYDWTNIANALLRVGWTSKVVDCLLKTYCEANLSFLPSFSESGIDDKIA